MKKLRVYLDNCCFNRPYDDQTQLRIELETKAKLFLQNLVFYQKVDLVWSYMLDYENSKNSIPSKQFSIQRWQQLAITDIDETPVILKLAEEIKTTGVKNADALHVACAIVANCDYFVTVDARLLKYRTARLTLCDPIDFLKVWSEAENGK